ncbi:MAG: phosphate transport system regulatory protein PhoU, partial [Ectothiorhodospiraceae bacterium]|nr:phosphate transport system regulatory protein PhoU [Ectothiorhodospiraceae bacterium]
MTERTFRLFDKELDKLRTRLLKMGSVAFEQVDCAFKALLDTDHELVKKVIDWEAKVDKYDVKIDRLCMRMLALQQPVAKDLRSVMTALALNSILERIGDLAVNIAEHIEHLIDHQELVASSPLPKMEPVIAEMLKDSFDAYLYEDVELARRVAEMDNELDDL